MLWENYRIIHPLGNKQPRRFGEIYLVESTRDSQKAILKVVDKRKCDTIAVERLRNEAKFSFDFAGLPTILEFSEDTHMIYLIRNYFPGETIDSYWGKLRKREKMSFLVQLLTEINVLLERLQLEQIIHADIKPGNILIADSLDGITISLIDFGLSIKKEALENRSLLFPLGYAAPELVLNHLEIADYRTDYFAIGILIWRLFADKMPLVHPNPSVFTNLQITHPLPDHESLPRKMLPHLQKLAHKYRFELPPNRISREEVRQKLIIGRDQRYSDLADFISDIEPLKSRRYFF